MNLKVYKSYEISDSLWQMITEGFNEAFDSDRTVDQMRDGFFLYNQFGYGYHAVALSDEGELMGYNVFSPSLYKNGLKVVVSGSTYVRNKFRNNEMLFLDMVNALRSKCLSDGFQVEVGVPNNNSRKFAIKVLKYRYVADLNYYVLPIRVSKMLDKKNLLIFDAFSLAFSFVLWLFSWILSVFINAKEKSAKYELLLDDTFFSVRFPQGKYQNYLNGRYSAYYRIYEENNARVIYLLDFRENGNRTFRGLVKAVRHIMKNDRPDAIMFVGFLRLFQTLLLRVPDKFVPKRLPFTCRIMDSKFKEEYEDMAEDKNWNFSLINFDVR